MTLVRRIEWERHDRNHITLWLDASDPQDPAAEAARLSRDPSELAVFDANGESEGTGTITRVRVHDARTRFDNGWWIDDEEGTLGPFPSETDAVDYWNDHEPGLRVVRDDGFEQARRSAAVQLPTGDYDDPQ